MMSAGSAAGDSGAATCATEVRLIEELSMNAWPALSTRFLDGILAAGRRLGAEAAYLQVLAGNAAAERLYAGLGFTDAYVYHYRKSP